MALVLSALATVPVLALPREKDRWIELTTANFTLYSGSSRSNTQEIAHRLEQLRAVLAQLTSWKVDFSVPTHIYIFAGDAELTPYKSLRHDGKPVAGAGYFLARRNSNFIAIDGSEAHDPVTRIYHEYVHALVHQNFPGAPLWLNEGLAEYYSSFEASGGRAEIGRPIARHVAELRRSQLIPLAELFAIDADSAEYDEGERRGAFYAECWALVHYLMAGSREREGQLSRFLQLVRAGEGEREAFREAFATGHRVLEEELRAYVRERELPLLRIEVGELDDFSFEIRAMPYPEVLARLGNLLTYLDRPEAATEHFEAARKRRPADPLALAGLADLARHQEHCGEALAFYVQALRAGADDFLVLYRYAECLLAESDDDPEALTKAVSALRRSVALEARFEPAQALLAYVLLTSSLREAGTLLKEERYEEALQLLERLRAEAGPEDLPRIEEELRELRRVMDHNRFVGRYNEALRLIQGGDLASARAVLEKLVAASEGSQAEDARVLLAKIDREERLATATEQVNRLLAQRRLEEAIEVFRQVEVVPDSREGRWIEGQIAEIQRALAHDRFVDRFNEAIGHLNAGKAQAACEVLEDLLAGLPEESSEAERARTLLVKARAELKRRGGHGSD